MQNIKKKEDLLVCDIFFIEIMTLCQSIGFDFFLSTKLIFFVCKSVVSVPRN